MQDSTITYRVTTAGIAEAEAKFRSLGATIKNVTINQNGSVTATGNLSREQADLANRTDRAAAATNRASKAQASYFEHIAKTTIQSALVNKLFLGLVDAAGQAVKQVDLMQNFPASMAALGLSASDAREALGTLRDYIAQIGGDLTNATSSVARFAEVTKDVKAATAEFVGVNNALIAGGAGAQVQANALEQLIQAYSRGKPQLIEWRSLMVAMPAQLNQVAKAMNFNNAQALGEALTSDKVSMQDFITELTKLSTGTGPIAQQAIARMQGIQFAANVMKNTLTNGLAAIYQAIGRNNIIAFFNFVTQVIIVLSQWVVILINNLISLFNWISGIFGGPQIAHFTGEAAGAADAIGSGAESAGELADNLGDAGKNAKSLNKSLAAFDKMNVLPDKTSGSGGSGGSGGGGGGAGGIDPATAGMLGDIFDGLGKKLQEVSGWAKLFAGILAGILALRFGKYLLKDFNDTIKTLKDATKSAKDFGKAVKDIGKGISTAFKGGKAEQTEAGKGIGMAIVNGIATAIGATSKQIWKYLLVPLGAVAAGVASAVGTAVAGAVAAGAAALGVSVGAFVLIIIAIVAAVVAAVVLVWKYWDQIWGFMKNTFDTVWGAIVSTWNTFYDIFAPPIKWLIQFFDAAFTLMIAITAIALEIMFKLVVGTITLIYKILSAIQGWVYDNVIIPIVNLFVSMWNTVVLAAKTAWGFIFSNILLPVASWININVIQPVMSLFRGLWDVVSAIINVFFGNVKNILGPLAGWIKANVIDRIASYFSSLWDNIRNGLSSMINALGSIFGNLSNIARVAINGLVDVFNSLFRRLSSIKVPDWVPGYGGKSVNFPTIPRLAKGGIVDQPTLAMFGEAGKEAVIPLENNTEWMDMLASKISGGPSGPVQLTVQIGEDKIITKVIELINEKTQMSGRNVIYV